MMLNCGARSIDQNAGFALVKRIIQSWMGVFMAGLSQPKGYLKTV
jgi:hypothetical protein